MTIRAVLSPDTANLWRTFAGTFLDELGDRTGPGGYPSFAWLTHRLQRDLLWKEAADRGLAGWLKPPHAFFSDFPRLFAIDQRRLGLLERQIVLESLVAETARDTGFSLPAAAATLDRPGLGRAVDQVIGELLPEGVTPETLQTALAALPDQDEFSLSRNRWLAETFRRYRLELARRNAYDFRGIHDLVASRIEQGGLAQSINGAGRLHVYGMTSSRTRRRLIQALAKAPDVEVICYLQGEALDPEWRDLIEAVTISADPAPPAPTVQPAPDEIRELQFVACEIKRLVTDQSVSLDEIAVVARTGREDARFAHETLERAGIPTTARVRTTLDCVPALVALLQLFRAAALGWRYRPLRHVLESSYFKLDLDLKPFDHLAQRQRIVGLADWKAGLEGLRDRLKVGDDDDRELRSFRLERIERAITAFDGFVADAQRLSFARSLAEWVRLTTEMLDPGWFDLRRRICRIDGDRHDVVRLDQQSVAAAIRLLDEWAEAETSPEPLTPLQWYQRLRRLLGASEITLSTPRRTGVQVIEAHEAALVPFRHTFLIHANEGEFPKAQTTGWLLTDAERAALAAHGLPLSHRALGLERERQLWRAVTGGPSVTVTYRTADPAGVPLLPSLLVPDHDVETEIPRTRFVWDHPFTPHLAERAAVEELRVAADRAGGSAPSLVTPEHESVRLAVLRAVAESRRLGSAGAGRPAGLLGPWTGHLRDPAVLAVVGERFGADRIWSASQLECWGQNPFLFLIQRILYLEEQLEVDDEVNVMVRGSVAHRLLERFFAEVKAELPAPFASFAARFDGIAAEVFAEFEQDGKTWLGLNHLWRIRRESLLKMARDYLDWDLGKKMKKWLPHELELAFGEDDRPAFVVGNALDGAATRIRLRGRIDRLDAARSGGGEILVIDYKSGQTPGPKGYRDGAVLQGPLYLSALVSLGIPATTAEYRSIRGRKCGAEVDLVDEDCRRAISLALTMPALIRSGRFEPRAAESIGWRSYWPGGLALFRAEAEVEGSRFE